MIKQTAGRTLGLKIKVFAFFDAPFFSRIFHDHAGCIFLMQDFLPVWHVKSPASKLDAKALKFI